MFKKFFLISLLVSGFLPSFSPGFASMQDSVEVNAITNCSGTQVVRVAPGRFEVRTVAANLPGCISTVKTQAVVASPVASISTGTTSPVTLTVSTGSTATGVVHTGTTNTGVLVTLVPTLSAEVTNCNGTRVSPLSNGGYAITRVALNLPGCISTTPRGEVIDTPRIDLSHGPLLDLASTDIVNYRVTQIKKQGIRFANALRSVRMRRMASMQARTEAYLMRNDAVVVEGKETGWVKVQGADVIVTDTHENTVEADTTGKASGYTAGKYLRDPNANDLVRIEQADQAYWSDIAHVGVRYANVRANPWYTAPIVTTLSKGYTLYVVATVDNWSQVRNDEGTVEGYIRSDLLTIDTAQRVDNPNTGK